MVMSDCKLQTRAPCRQKLVSVGQTTALHDTVGFNLIGRDLGRDARSSLQAALRGGTVFAKGTTPMAIFREALAASIRQIENHPRGRLFQEFLRRGPYEDVGPIPRALVRQRLSDEQVASAITFIYSHMVNSFKGALTELLAAKPCLQVLRQLRHEGRLPSKAQLYVGDAVLARRASGRDHLKAADLHILVDRPSRHSVPGMIVAGVTEVKSYVISVDRLQRQLQGHLARARRGLRVGGTEYTPEQVQLGSGKRRHVIRITVVPSRWTLSRCFHFVKTQNGRRLIVDRKSPSLEEDRIVQGGDSEWHVVLRWSEEAIAEAAYEMTFWYMEKVGEVIYAAGVPREWKGMTPAEAGRNAVKMMLYYAILRCRGRVEQRTIALYNSYGFGYALGMNFRNAKGRREMLWPQDLDEILAAGKTRSGSHIG